jgi:hypothetical protein
LASIRFPAGTRCWRRGRTPGITVAIPSGLNIKKKTAHRKIKPQGGLSYSLAEVISLAFSLSPQAPQRTLG